MKNCGKEHFGAIDGLRLIACTGILMMHISENNGYEIEGFFYQTVLPSFTDFVFLFMMISSFGMCCGYYEKVRKNQVSWSDFYAKRFRRVLPFFGLLVLLDIVMTRSVASLYEGFADITLLFGFIQKPISVIGVGWFLGLVFVFYLIFPFFCVLLENKRRAWGAFGVSLIYNFACAEYFKVGRGNILYSGCFFLAGGLIYLHRDEIAELNRWIVLGILGVSVVLYYATGENAMVCLPVSAALLIYAIIVRGGVLENRVTGFFSGISMEIYLSHMIIFRLIERLGLNRWFGNGWMSYAVTVIAVFCGTTVFVVLMKRIVGKVMKMVAIKLRS